MADLHFYANVCHICKKRSSENLCLKSCTRCRMIFYCSRKHMLQDRQRHQDVCHAIRYYNIIAKRNGIPTSVKVLGASQWLHSKYSFMTAVEKTLNRPLTRPEKEMFLFPKACVECHKQEGVTEYVTKYSKCISKNVCKDHKKENDNEEDVFYDNNFYNNDDCKTLETCFFLDVCVNQPENMDTSYIKHLSPSFKMTQMSSFFKKYIKPYVRIKNYEDYITQLSFHSLYATDPMTTLHAIRSYMSYPNHILIIYVITSKYRDVAAMRIWEIMMHFFIGTMSIYIMLLGPNLQTRAFRNVDLCESCALRNKKLFFATSPHIREYIEFMKPDMVISFDARIWLDKATFMNVSTYRYTADIHNWKDVLQALRANGVTPIIITCYSEKEKLENVNAVKTIFHERKYLICCEKNPFASLRPLRDPETENPIFHNAYVVTIVVRSNFYVFPTPMGALIERIWE